ncbi:MAG: hypothetical protein RJA49_1528 [Actinomycetota bacterium]
MDDTINDTPIPFDPACELCEAAPLTPRFYEDDVCWVAECESCSVPMVVWKRHDPNPPEEVRVELLTRLSEVVVAHYEFEHWVDPLMRSIPTHFHAHARPRGGISGHGSRRG